MGCKITGNLTVNTGADDDWVYIANTPIGGNVSINTGAGADTAELQNLPGTIGGSVDIQLYSSLAEKDADVAWLDHVYAYGNINVPRRRWSGPAASGQRDVVQGLQLGRRRGRRQA